MLGVGRLNLHCHEMRVCFCPGQRLLLGVEKTIDNDGIALGRISSTRARSFAIDHTGPAVHGHTCRVGKDNFAGIGNFLWIDGAMPAAQSSTVPRCMLARTFAMPVNRDARER